MVESSDNVAGEAVLPVEEQEGLIARLLALRQHKEIERFLKFATV